ncbi:MAG: DUF669 domain-containing protein [Candidatus Onthovivens sp.]|nr:DUF669 domain-containing protein [Candidatus Onthovivens sp.]
MSKFDEMFDLEDIIASVNEIESNNKKDGDFPEVPVGKYEVKIEKIELASTKDGKPMGKVMMRIAEGDYKKQCLFYNQVLVGTDKNTNQLTAYGIHKFNQFLKSLDSGLTIEFKDFKQYEDLLLDVAEEVEKLTYLIEYSKVNDFATYKVKEIYED